MSKATHMLAMAGMALVAGAAFGTTPAAAAPAAPQATTGVTSAAAARPQGQAGDRFAGYYRTERICERVGRAGEFIGRWNSYDCREVSWGPRDGWWILTVDNRWHGDHHGGHWGGHGGHHGGHWGGHGGHHGGHWGGHHHGHH
jgi:hypothetical protein